MSSSGDDVDLTREVGEVIRAWRLARGLTGAELGQRAGTTKAYISLLETGRITRPGRARLAAIAQALDVQVAILLTLRLPEESDEPPSQPTAERESPMHVRNLAGSGLGLGFPIPKSTSPRTRGVEDALERVRRHLEHVPPGDRLAAELELLHSFLAWREHAVGEA